MPKRPRSHELEDTSRNRLHEIFTSQGWVVWDLHPDYGEDLFVRIFENGTATHYSFFIQAKATDHIDRYMQRDGKSINFPIDAEHINHWHQFWEPVLLTVWDAQSNITYWEVIQDYLDDIIPGKSRRKHLYVNIPTTNILDERGVKSVLERTKLRFERFELLSQGAQLLINLLEERTGVQIEYNPGGMVLMIHTPNSEEVQMYALGKIARILHEMAIAKHMTEQQVFNDILREAGAPVSEFSS